MQVPPNSGYLANDVQPGGPSETWHEAYAPLDHHRDQYPTTASLEPFLASPAITVDHQMVGDEVITAVTGGGDLLDGGRLFACQDCDKQFPRHCDLKKHSNSHIRPYKCPVRDCKYHELGWPSEKELTRHHNDKHASSPCTFHCHFSQCAYTSKRESNCKQHMEKVHGWNYVRSRLTKPYKCPVAGCLTCADQVESREKHPEYPALEAAAAAMASSPSRLVAQPQADFELFGDADPSAHDETAFYPWTSPESRFRRHTDILQTFGNNGSVIAGQAMTPVDPNLAAMSFGTVAFSDSVDLGASQPGRRHSAAVMGGSSTGALDAMVVQPSSQQAGQHSAMLTPASTVLGPESVRVYAMSRSGSTDQTPLKRFPPLDTTSLGDAMSKGLFTPSDEEKSGRPAPSSAQTVDICVSGFGTMHHVKPESASTGGGVGVAHWVDGQPTSFLTSTALLDDNQADDGDDDDDEEDEPPRKRTKQSAQDTFDETNMLCPFHVAYPDKYNVNQMQTYGSCHTKHRDISTIVRHLKRSAHRLKVDERSISSFDVEMVPHVHPAVGLCRSCWRAYTDRDEFERHLQEPCANVSRGKREKYNALKDTFCPIILDDGRILPPAVPFGQPSFDMAVSRGDSVAAPDHFGQIGESRSDILDTAVSVQPPTSLRGGSEGGEAVVKLSEHLALQRRVETLERSISTILQAWQQPSGNVTVTAPPTPMNLTGASLSYGTDLSMQGHAAGQQQANATGSAKQEHGGADQQQQHHHLADFGDASGLNMLSDMNARKALSLSTTGHHQPHDHHSLSPTPRYHNVVSESPTTMIAAAHRGSVVAAGPRSQSLDRRPKRPYGSGSGYELHAGLEQDVQRRFVHTPQQQQQQQQQSLHQQQQQQHQHQGNQARLHGQAGGGAGFIPRTTAQQQLPDTVDWSLAPMGIGEDELADSFSTSYVSGPNTLP